MTVQRFLGLCASLGAVLSVTACSGNPSPGTLKPADDGIYEFIANTGDRTPLRGRLTIVAGEISLEPEVGICRVDTAYSSLERTRYACDNVSDIERLAFVMDNRNPLTRSSWTGQVRQRRTRTVCVEYATQNGRRVCVRTQTETYDAMVPVSGRLTFRPLT